MFLTFSARPDGVAPSQAQRGRPPRVMQACARCRRNRLRCDDERPCRSCKKAGSTCFDQDSCTRAPARATVRPVVPGLPRAVSSHEPVVALSQPRSSSQSDFLPAEAPVHSDHANSNNAVTTSQGATGRLREAKPCPSQSAGSWQLFVQHLDSAIRSGSSHPNNYDPSLLILTPSSPPVSILGAVSLEPLDRVVEERLLSSFLQSYQVIAPVISVPWLWKYHAQLWAGGSARQSCHFIDILLALSIHQAISLADDNADDSYQMDGAPGYQYFERSQIDLLRSTAQPNLLTVQSYMYASIYMTHVHQTYKAHQMLALAVQNANMMDHQIDPPFIEGLNGVIVRARTWLALRTLDNIFSTTAGTPHLISCQTSQELVDTAVHEFPETLQIYEAVSAMESFVQVTKLAQLARDASASCSAHVNGESRSSHGPEVGNRTGLCSATASIVKTSMRPIHDWARSLPAALRNSEGKADREGFDTECEIPMWIRRQSLFLRTGYHMVCMILLRPFACEALRGEEHNPTAAELSVACTKHASAVTAILDANLDSGSFNVLSQATGCQWLATLCLIGFMMAHPTSPHTTAVRKTLSVCKSNFERLSKRRVPQAREAITKTNVLFAIAEREVQHAITALSSLHTPLNSVPVTSLPPSYSTENVSSAEPNFPTDLGFNMDWETLLWEMDFADSTDTASATR